MTSNRNRKLVKQLLKTYNQRTVDVDMLNAVKGVLADVSSVGVSPSSEQLLTETITVPRDHNV